MPLEYIAAGVAVSIRAPREGSDAEHDAALDTGEGFQSAPPVRGATPGGGVEVHSQGCFNPRPP